MILKYNPKKIRSSWTPTTPVQVNVPFLGLMDGTFIEVEFEEDQVTTHVGSDGTVSFVLNANTLAKATIHLVQGSPTNTQLSKYLPSAARNSLPAGAFQMSDLNGLSLVHADQAVIQKIAKTEFAKNITGRPWVFLLPEATIVVAGNE